MAVDERRRRQLEERLTSAVGAEATATMLEMLPPDGEAPATAVQVAELSGRLDRGLEHVNSRIDRLEVGMADLRTTVQTLSRNVDTLESRFDTLESRFDTLENRFDTLENRFDTLTGKVADLDGRFDTLTEDVANLGGRFDTLTDTVTGLDRRMDAWGHQLDTQAHRLEALVERSVSNAVSGQTRAMIMTVLTTLVGIVTVTFTFQQVL